MSTIVFFFDRLFPLASVPGSLFLSYNTGIMLSLSCDYAWSPAGPVNMPQATIDELGAAAPQHTHRARSILQLFQGGARADC